ncbi:MAG: hypothetical protein H7835_06840 [Magnetococcus sp. XQGC-1]
MVYALESELAAWFFGDVAVFGCECAVGVFGVALVVLNHRVWTRCQGENRGTFAPCRSVCGGWQVGGFVLLPVVRRGTADLLIGGGYQ